MNQADHIPLIEKGVNSMIEFNNQIYACASNKIYIINTNYDVQVVEYEFEEIYQFIKSKNQILGKDLYGNTYQIEPSGITRFQENILSFYPNGIKITKIKENCIVSRNNEEILNLGGLRYHSCIFNNDLGIFAVRAGRNKHKIMAFKLGTNRITWSTSLELVGDRVQQLLFTTESHLYIITYDKKIQKISLIDGKIDQEYCKEYSQIINNISTGKVDKDSNTLITPEHEICIDKNLYFSRVLNDGILSSGTPKLEIFYNSTDYTFDNKYVYIQIHTYPDFHNKQNTSEILQILRRTDTIANRFYVNPSKRSIDAKRMIKFNNDLIILDVHGKLMRKQIEYKI